MMDQRLANSFERLCAIANKSDDPILAAIVEVALALNLQTEMIEEERKSAFPQVVAHPYVMTAETLTRAVEERDRIQSQLDQLDEASTQIPDELRPMMLAVSKQPLEQSLRLAEEFISRVQAELEAQAQS